MSAWVKRSFLADPAGRFLPLRFGGRPHVPLAVGVSSARSKQLDMSRPTVPDDRGSWLVRPLSNWWCALGWLGSTVPFVGIVQVLGGPSSGDADETTISSWPIAHAEFTCAFPKGRITVAPLYPFVSGFISAVARLGNGVPFPTRQAFGPDCSTCSER